MPAEKSLMHQADCLYSLPQIETALTQLAEQITAEYADKNPLLLCVMTGAVITLGHLLPKLAFELEVDYLHASRYGNKTSGGELVWYAKPQTALANRHVLLVEDIYDEGPTLMALRDFCQRAGAASVSCVALVEKHHDRKSGVKPEYIGLTVPDRYVFGFGMDVSGYWRNAPGIFALKETA